MVERRLRAALTTSFSAATCASASASAPEASGCGKGATMTLSPALPASGATFCHSSSVMKGMIGCARRRVASSTRISVRRVARCSASLPRASCALASSTYQSQYSSHTNS